MMAYINIARLITLVFVRPVSFMRRVISSFDFLVRLMVTLISFVTFVLVYLVLRFQQPGVVADMPFDHA